MPADRRDDQCWSLGRSHARRETGVFEARLPLFFPSAPLAACDKARETMPRAVRGGSLDYALLMEI
jgi:hypothetical protein